MPEPSASQHISLSSSKSFAAHRCEVLAVGRGYETDPRRYAYENRHRQKFSLLQYTLAGEGRFRASPTGPDLALPAPRAFLINCPSPSSYWLPVGKRWEFVYLLFVGELAAWHVEQINASQGPVFDLPATSAAAVLLQCTYQEAAARQPLDKYLLSARAYQILMEIYRLKQTAQVATPHLDQAIRFIEREYGNAALTVADIARQAGLSPYHFSRLFRRRWGVSPNVYLTQVRLNHARNLLSTTLFPVKQVAQLVGFSDSSYFCKIFRRQHQLSPGDARRR